ncbi:MAG: ATP synthase subunit I [Tissierellia bacterium]|nr:ATP synthase subunit I [Tissierellia bacterium]
MTNKIVDHTIKALIIRCVAVNLILAGIWQLTISESSPWVKGQVLGGLVSILMFLQMKNTLERALVCAPDVANRKVRVGYMMRMLIYGLVLALSILSEDINFITVIIGIISMKYIVLLSAVFDEKLLKKRPNNNEKR